MKVSIVTVVYNNCHFIRDAIESVAAQDHPDIEHIIVDGGSSDGTLEIIKSFAADNRYWISEHDEGIYDAMNKGIRFARGEIIGILNSDDLYLDQTIISKIVSVFTKQQSDCVYGDLVYVDPLHTDHIIRYWKSSVFIPGSFQKGWHPPHPAFFVKKKIYDQYGLYDNCLKVSADFELMLRFLEKERISSSYYPHPLIKMRTGGKSNRRLRDILVGNINCYRAFKKNYLKVPIFYILYRWLPKMRQFFTLKQ